MEKILLATGLLFSVGVTHAVTLNFNDTAPHERFTDFGPNGSYTEKGFTFKATNESSFNTFDKGNGGFKGVYPPVDETDFGVICDTKSHKYML